MHLAQINLVHSLYPVTDERMLSFTSRLSAIQALAERSPGFIWRDLTDAEDADFTGYSGHETPGQVLANMSVWDGLESLFAFVYKTAHAKVMTISKDNFQPFKQDNFVLWWVPKGHKPSGKEAKKRLDDLRRDGPAPTAFTFKKPFSETGQPVSIHFSQKDFA